MCLFALRHDNTKIACHFFFSFKIVSSFRVTRVRLVDKMEQKQYCHEHLYTCNLTTRAATRCTEFIMRMHKNTQLETDCSTFKHKQKHNIFYVVDTLEMCIHKESDKINKLLVFVLFFLFFRIFVNKTEYNSMHGDILAENKKGD